MRGCVELHNKELRDEESKQERLPRIGVSVFGSGPAGRMATSQLLITERILTKAATRKE